MYCPECGMQNKLAAKFCEQCGHELEVKTASTGADKPLGIVVISILSVLSGVAQIGAGWIFAFVPHLIGFVATMTGQGIGGSDHIASLKLAGIAILLFSAGILTLASAYGLWNFIGWGRILSVVLNGLSLFVGIILFFTALDASQSAGGIALQLFGFGVGIWILIFLFRPAIRDLFHGAGVFIREPDDEPKAHIATRLG